MKTVFLLDRRIGEIVCPDSVAQFVLQQRERARVEREEIDPGVVRAQNGRLLAALLISGWAVFTWDDRRSRLTCEIATPWRAAMHAVQVGIHHFDLGSACVVALLNYQYQIGSSMPCDELLDLCEARNCVGLLARTLRIEPRSPWLSRKAIVSLQLERTCRQIRREAAQDKQRINEQWTVLNNALRPSGAAANLRASTRLVLWRKSQITFLHPAGYEVGIRPDRLDVLETIIATDPWALLVVEAADEAHPVAGIKATVDGLKAHGALAEILDRNRRHIQWLRLFLVVADGCTAADFRSRVSMLPDHEHIVHTLLRSDAILTLHKHAGDTRLATAGTTLVQLERFIAETLFPGATVEVVGTYRNLRWSMLQYYPRILSDL